MEYHRYLGSLFLHCTFLWSWLLVVTANGDGIAEQTQLLSQDSPELLDLLASELEHRPADGGFVWHNVCTNVLQESSGVLRNGELTVILGPSGSGKTSFLTALAQMSPISGGEIGRFQVDKHDEIVLTAISSQQVGYLQQHDDFFNQLTVFETLQLASYLELPTISKEAREERILQVVQQLGLHGALHRRIGDRSMISSSPQQRNKQAWGALDGRLSGGERRRLSVALELLTAKQILIADEPTSGLDSAYSDTVVKLLKDLAQSQNIPAVASLHQPRSSIWNRLDSVILMAPGGRICYAGDRGDVVQYFSKLGYKLPPNTNPAEFLLDLVSIDSENLEQAVKDEARVNTFEHIFRNRPVIPSDKRSYSLTYEDSETWNAWGGRKSLIRWIPRLGALFLRSWRQNIRDTNLSAVRLLISIGNAVLLSGIFPTVKAPGPLVSSVADRVALLSFSAINLIMLAYMKSVTLFARERKVIQREQTREQYSSFEYLVAKCFAEMPLDAAFSLVFSATLKRLSGLIIPLEKLAIVFVDLTVAGASLGYLLGSIAPQNESYASTAGIPILVVLMIVGVINPSGVDLSRPPPLVVQILKKVSPIALGIEALCIGEYPGVHFKQGSESVWSRVARAPRMGGLALIRNGDQVLRALGLHLQTFTGALRHLTIIAAGNMFFSWISLMIRRQYNRNKMVKRGKKAQNRGTVAKNKPISHRKLRF